MLTFLFSFGQTPPPPNNRLRQRRMGESHFQRMAVKLCSVRDYLQHRRIQTIPLVRLSLTYPEAANEATPLEGSSGAGGGGGGSLVLTSTDNSKSKESKSGAVKDPSQDVSLLQKFKNMIELKRESYEVEKRRKAARAMSSASSIMAATTNKQDPSLPPTGLSTSSSTSSIQNPFDLLRKLSPSKSFDQGRGAGKVDQAGEAKRTAEQAKEQTPVKKDITENGGKEEDDQRMSSANKNAHLRRRVPLLNEIGRSKTVKSSDIYRESEINEKVEEKEVGDGKGAVPEEMPESSAGQSLESMAQPNSMFCSSFTSKLTAGRFGF